MHKQSIKKMAKVAVVLATALTCFQAPYVLATNDTATARANGENNAKVAINKVLNIAEGITTPNATFKFTFTPKSGTSSNGAPYELASDTDLGKGHIPDRTVSYLASDTVTENKITKATEDIFAGVSYDHAGEYVYTVKEEAGTYKATEGLDDVKYDAKTYDMHVIVKNKAEAGTYISSVFFKENGTTTAAEKTEPSTTTDKETFTYDLFENTYTKQAGKMTPGTGGGKDTVQADAKALTIKKQVTGGSGDRSKQFTFNLVITLPSTNQKATNPLQTITVHYGDKTDTVTVENDGLTLKKTFTLKHNETLTIDSLPAGSRYSITELGTKGYTASASYLENGLEKTDKNGKQGADYSVNGILIGEKTNSNTITNDLPEITPTGLLIDNLPFILMIGIGATGLVVLARKRRDA